MIPRRLLLTADAVGGVFTYAVDLASALAPLGVRTTLAIIGPTPDDAQRRAARAVPGLDLVETGFQLDWLATDAPAAESVSPALALLARRIDADLVHVNSAAQAVSGDFGVPVVVGHHSCLATWWRAVRGDAPMPADFRWKVHLAARGLAAADLVFAPSRAFAATTSETYRIPLPAVIRNGRARIPGGAVRASDREAFAVFAGRLWDEGKNVGTLDRAAAGLSHPVIAAGPQRGPDGTMVRPAHLLTTGPQSSSAVRDLLRRAAVFVSAARYEPFGLTALEAAQTGCPLVLSDIPAHRELWDGAALFVAPDDHVGFCKAMRAVIDKDALRADLAAAARERAGRYTVEAMARETLAAYAAVLGVSPVREAAG